MAENYDDRLAGYVEVHTRLAEFIEKYPEGSMQGSYEVSKLGEQIVIVYHALAYRHPNDERPGVGFASEPVPGATPYTRNSELMNAETSAWGRALAAIGIRVHDGVASANEVRARRTDDDEKPVISPKQMDFFSSLLKKNGVDGDEMQLLTAYAQDNLSGGRAGSMSSAIDLLKKDPGRYLERLRDAAVKWDREQSVVGPAPDDMDLPPLTDLTDD